MTAFAAVAAVLLAAVVIGIMSAGGQTLREHPETFATAMLFVSAISLGLQALAVLILRNGPECECRHGESGNHPIFGTCVDRKLPPLKQNDETTQLQTGAVFQDRRRRDPVQ